MLRPLLWPQRWLGEVKGQIFAMMWRELIHNESESSELANLLAFLIFSALCLYSYRAEVVPYLSTALLALWPLGWVYDRWGRSRRPGGGVSLAFDGGQMRWRFSPIGGRRLEALIRREGLKRVAVRHLACPGGGPAAHLAWQVALATEGGEEYPVQAAASFGEAWRRALPLARGLKLPLVAAESLGCGLGVDARSRPVLDPGEDRFWRRSTDGGGTRLARDWRSIRLGGLVLAGLEDAGYLLFLILAGAVMMPSGHLLDWLLGGSGSWSPGPLRLRC